MSKLNKEAINSIKDELFISFNEGYKIYFKNIDKIYNKKSNNRYIINLKDYNMLKPKGVFIFTVIDYRITPTIIYKLSYKTYSAISKIKDKKRIDVNSNSFKVNFNEVF